MSARVAPSDASVGGTADLNDANGREREAARFRHAAVAVVQPLGAVVVLAHSHNNRLLNQEALVHSRDLAQLPRFVVKERSKTHCTTNGEMYL